MDVIAKTNPYHIPYCKLFRKAIDTITLHALHMLWPIWVFCVLLFSIMKMNNKQNKKIHPLPKWIQVLFSYYFHLTSFILYFFWWENKISCLIAIFIDFLFISFISRSRSVFQHIHPGLSFSSLHTRDLFKVSLKSTPLNNMRSTICFDLVQKPNTQKVIKVKHEK